MCYIVIHHEYFDYPQCVKTVHLVKTVHNFVESVLETNHVITSMEPVWMDVTRDTGGSFVQKVVYQIPYYVYINEKEKCRALQEKETSLFILMFNLFCIVTECDNGTFGKDCTESCGNCVKDGQCHFVNGTCMNGCVPGFSGPFCIESNIFWVILD